MGDHDEVTRVLDRIAGGDQDAVNMLFPLVYDELRQMAGAFMRGERRDHTLQPTALVHDAYMKLVGQDRANWQGRAHFLAVAAQQMRRVLVDHARSRDRRKRGGGAEKVTICVGDVMAETRDVDLLQLDEALGELASFNPAGAQIVELKFFGGLTNTEVGQALGVSRSSVDRGWDLARRWLLVQMTRGDTSAASGNNDGP